MMSERRTVIAVALAILFLVSLFWGLRRTLRSGVSVTVSTAVTSSGSSVKEGFLSETSLSKPVRSYGTLLKSIPQVRDTAKRFATSRAAKFSSTVSLPKNFDGRTVWKDYITPVSSQGSCGNCWAHATTSALADRFAIFSLGEIKFTPSPYEITVCAHKFTDIKNQWGNTGALELMDDYLHGRKVDPSSALQSAACEGSSLYTAAEVLYTDGVPELSCFPDRDTVNGQTYDVSKTSESDPSNLPYCLTLETMDFDTCTDQKTAAKKYRAKTAYNIGDPTKDSVAELETAIKYEIYKHGPVPTGFQVYSDFMDSYDGKTVYTHPDVNAQSDGGHAVKIVGWGEDGVDSLGNQNIPYWIIQNSWGKDWGEGGFFKMKRGVASLQTEQNAMGMIPDFPGVTISDPNIIPIETSGDIAAIISFPDHYLDPYTGFYLSGIEKIRNCQLQGVVVPYIDPKIPLPDYSTFYAAEITSYLVSHPLPVTTPMTPSVVCGSSTGAIIGNAIGTIAPSDSTGATAVTGTTTTTIATLTETTSSTSTSTSTTASVSITNYLKWSALIIGGLVTMALIVWAVMRRTEGVSLFSPVEDSGYDPSGVYVGKSYI